MTRPLLLAAGLFTVLSAGEAIADIEAVATSDLHLRAGPGPAYTALDVIPARVPVSVEVCDAGGTWCRVTYDGRIGWAYAPYLANRPHEDVAILSPEPPTRRVTTVIREDTRTRSAAIVGGMGAIAGALVAGPAGAALGLVGGATTGGIADPGPKVTTYVVETPVPPVYLEGDLVPGAYIPASVVLHPVPESEYSYAYVNDRPVLVHGDDRRVVLVLR